MKLAISFSISPPGAGKGTQAEFLKEKFGLVHFDTGRCIEEKVRSKEAERDPILKREKELFDSGILNTPAWVLELTREATNHIAKSGKGIVFSGSPRTIYEAIGDEKTEGLVKTLADLYGKKNVYFVKININEETTIERNRKRVVCSKGGFPLFSKEDRERCEKLGGEPQKRTLDDPEIIKERLKEYETRTAPIIKRLKEENYSILEIDGNPKPSEVFQLLLKTLNLESRK
ncbi:MAG: nucleoside monophosphate kinase [bacterium]|nr:nucleoside monophosphate kinase [bacterium]